MTRASTRGFLWSCAAFVVGGFVLIGLAWRGSARTLIVPTQLAYLVSGGLGGLTLIVTGTGLFTVQLGRQLAAEERHALDRLLLPRTTSDDDVVATDDDALLAEPHTVGMKDAVR
jgi:hypothetical protein